jgi:hypothetical protein
MLASSIAAEHKRRLSSYFKASTAKSQPVYSLCQKAELNKKTAKHLFASPFSAKILFYARKICNKVIFSDGQSGLTDQAILLE